jgi:hypothetical protein
VAEKCTVIELPGPTGRTINHHHQVSLRDFMEFSKDIKTNKDSNTYKLLRLKLFNSKMVKKTNNKNPSVGDNNFNDFFSFKANFILPSYYTLNCEHRTHLSFQVICILLGKTNLADPRN